MSIPVASKPTRISRMISGANFVIPKPQVGSALKYVMPPIKLKTLLERKDRNVAKALSSIVKTTANNKSCKVRSKNSKNLSIALKNKSKMQKQNLADELEDKRREQLEGGVCVDCILSGNGYTYQKPETDWGS